MITAFANALHADKTGERYWHITLPLWVYLRRSTAQKPIVNTRNRRLLWLRLSLPLAPQQRARDIVSHLSHQLQPRRDSNILDSFYDTHGYRNIYGNYLRSRCRLTISTDRHNCTIVLRCQFGLDLKYPSQTPSKARCSVGCN